VTSRYDLRLERGRPYMRPRCYDRIDDSELRAWARGRAKRRKSMFKKRWQSAEYRRHWADEQQRVRTAREYDAANPCYKVDPETGVKMKKKRRRSRRRRRRAEQFPRPVMNEAGADPETGKGAACQGTRLNLACAGTSRCHSAHASCADRYGRP